MDVVYSWVRAQPYPSRVLSPLFDNEKCSILSSSFPKLAPNCHISKCHGCLLIALGQVTLTLLNKSHIWLQWQISKLLNDCVSIQNCCGRFQTKEFKVCSVARPLGSRMPCPYAKWRRQFGFDSIGGSVETTTDTNDSPLQSLLFFVLLRK